MFVFLYVYNKLTEKTTELISIIIFFNQYKALPFRNNVGSFFFDSTKDSNYLGPANEVVS